MAQDPNKKAGMPVNAHGFTAEQLAKQQAKYDVVKAKAVVKWMNSVVGNGTVGTDGSDAQKLREELQDGVALCKLMNTLKAGSVADKVLNGNSKMKAMKLNQDNQRISHFAKACGAFMNRSVPFEAQDLRPPMDGDLSKVNMTAVVDGIFGFGVYCHQKKSNGAAGGIKPVANTGNKMD